MQISSNIAIKIFFICTLLSFVFSPTPTMAISIHDVGEETLNIVGTFKNAVSGWDIVLKSYALLLFKVLLGIDIAWLGIRSAFERPQLADLIKSLTITIFFAGIFLAAINHYQEWAWQIISQFQDIAKKLSPDMITSDSPIYLGLTLCTKIISNMSVWSPANSIVYALAAFIILICFALLSAQIIFIKCETTLAMTAAMILLGFGGSSFTKDYAINALRYVLAVAFKLFVISLLLGIGASFINEISVQKSPTFEELFVIIGAAVVLLSLTTTLPDVCAGIITGSHVSSGMALMRTAGTVAAVGVGTVFGGAAGAGALKTANTLANEEGKHGIGKALHIGKSLVGAGMHAQMDMPGQRMLKGMQSSMKSQLEQSRMKRNERGE